MATNSNTQNTTSKMDKTTTTKTETATCGKCGDEFKTDSPYCPPCCDREFGWGKTDTEGDRILAEALARAEEEKEAGKTGDCCLCDGRYERWGNNPYPLCAEDDTESRCCHACNDTKVIPARMVRMFRQDALRKRMAEAKAMLRHSGRGRR